MSESAFGVEHGETVSKLGGTKSLRGLLAPYHGAVPKGPSNEALVNRPKTMKLRSARRNAKYGMSAKPGRAMGS